MNVTYRGRVFTLAVKMGRGKKGGMRRVPAVVLLDRGHVAYIEVRGHWLRID